MIDPNSFPLEIGYSTNSRICRQIKRRTVENSANDHEIAPFQQREDQRRSIGRAHRSRLCDNVADDSFFILLIHHFDRNIFLLKKTGRFTKQRKKTADAGYPNAYFYFFHAQNFSSVCQCVDLLPTVVTVICDIGESDFAPCQCRSPALICTTSPTVISRSSLSVATMPLPAVTTKI